MVEISRSAAVPAAVWRASSPAAPGARRPFGKLRAGSRDSRQDAGATLRFSAVAVAPWSRSNCSIPLY